MLSQKELEEKLGDCCKEAVSKIKFNTNIPKIDPREYGVYYEPVVLGSIFEETLKNNIIGMNTRDWCDWAQIDWDPTVDCEKGDAQFYEDVENEDPCVRIDVKIGTDYFGAISKSSIERFGCIYKNHYYCLVRMKDNRCLFINAVQLKKYYDEFKDDEKIEFIGERWLKEHTPFVNF